MYDMCRTIAIHMFQICNTIALVYVEIYVQNMCTISHVLEYSYNTHAANIIHMLHI